MVVHAYTTEAQTSTEAVENVLGPCLRCGGRFDVSPADEFGPIAIYEAACAECGAAASIEVEMVKQ